MSRALALASLLLVAGAALPLAQAPAESLDYTTLAKIRDEGLNRSQVMEHVSWLADVYGPRLTGSPGLDQAAAWAEKKLAEWGLANVHRETWPFGKGWSIVRFSATMIEPQVQPLIGVPAPWSPGTHGPVTAEVVRVQIDSEADFARYHGTLADKIVLTQPARAVPMLEGPVVLRMGPRDIEEARTVVPPARQPQPPARGAGGGGGTSFAARLASFYKAEGVVALFNRGSDSVRVAGGSDLSWVQQRPDGGTVFPTGSGSRGADAGEGLPIVTLAVEHYNRMVRVLDKRVPVRVELNLETRFHDDTTANGFNVIAEMPGSDPVLRDQVVMIGAHLDSMAAATGATDNAAGSAAMMEAMRILRAIGARPRRTIRLALWGGEEQGLLGSRAYVREHFGDPSTGTVKPEHAKLSAYFNSDNGTGRIRGIWLQGNTAVAPIFAEWIAPLQDLGVVALGPRAVTSTDHVPFDAAGLPGFQFMVDRLEYGSRTHHSNMDVYDRVQRDDLVQHAVVVASFAYDAAMRDALLPRKPLPGAEGR
jgi:hypothetical protein